MDHVDMILSISGGHEDLCTEVTRELGTLGTLLAVLVPLYQELERLGADAALVGGVRGVEGEVVRIASLKCLEGCLAVRARVRARRRRRRGAV